MTALWKCPQCDHQWNLDNAKEREMAIVSLLSHVLGIHTDIYDQIEEQEDEVST